MSTHSHTCRSRGEAEREGERKRQNIPSRLYAVSTEPDVFIGSDL